jgi:DNA-binding transcriptional regulator YdaS (Cro superfamily)
MSTTPPKPEYASPGASEGTNPPTLFDVARLANVSPSTVSRIINGSAKVSPERKRAVEDAISKLKFRPNFSAKSLRSGSTMTIGVLTQDFDSLYFARALKGIENLSGMKTHHRQVTMVQHTAAMALNAKGMCSNCYHKYGRTKKPWNCPHEKLYANGMCQNCYINTYNRKRREERNDEI